MTIWSNAAGDELPMTRYAEGTPHPSAAPTPSAERKAGEILLPGLDAGRVAVAAVDAIARLLKALDTEGYGEAGAYNFVEQVRGVLMLAHALTETEDDE